MYRRPFGDEPAGDPSGGRTTEPGPMSPDRGSPVPMSLDARWRHSSFSQGVDQTCVEVAVHAGTVAVRDSKDPTGPVLRFSFAEWAVFLRGLHAGEFELPAGARG